MTNPTVQPCHSAVLAILLLVGACPASLLAQAESADDAPPMRAARGELIKQADLDVRLIDEDGNLVPLLGFTLEEFVQLRERVRREQAANDRGISINGSIDLLATVDEEKAYCALDVTYKVRLSQRGESEELLWIPVPLRLDKAIVSQVSIDNMRPNDFFLHTEQEGFVGWIHAKPNTEHTIQVQAKIVISETGGTRTLNVKLPNLTTEARVVIPKLGLTVKRNEERSFITKEENDQQTVIKIDNAGGGVSVGWTEQPAVKPLVEVRGAMRVEVHANHVAAEATLKVRSRGEPISSFVVYMPPGMELTSLQVPGFQIATSDDPQHKRQAVAVRRNDGPTSSVIEITLRAAAPEIEQPQPNRLLQVAGFDVKEADLQLGTIDVAVKGNWSVTWKPDSFVQPEPVSVPVDATAVTARFVYDRQPFSLQVELQQKQRRVRVAADYIVRVGETQADLEADIHYETTGTETGAIKLDLAGWTIAGVRLGETALDEYEIDDNQVLTLPVDPSATMLDIFVQGQQTLPADGDRIAFSLPRPLDRAQPAVATVLVLPSENVELTPRVSEMKFLVEAAVPSDIELPSQTAPPFFYREELSTDTTEPSLFVARKRIRQRMVDASVATIARLRDTGLLVEQEIFLAISYGTANQLRVDVPTNVLDSGTLKFSIDDKPAAHEQLEMVDDSLPNLARVNVDLSGERTGNIVVRTQYSLAAEDVTSSNTIQIPLLQPTEEDSVTVSSNVLQVAAGESRAITLADEGWTRDNAAGEQPLPHNQLRLRTVGTVRSAPIRTASVEQQSSRKTSVSRAWLQTIISDSDRVDRVVFRLVSNEAQLHIQLPAVVDANGLQVAINGQAAEFRVGEDQLLRVTQPPALLGREVALEMLYWGDPATISRSTLQAALPKLKEAQRIDRVYWEVLLPRNRHLAWAPALVTPELVWRFEHLHWGPQGRLNQRQLEELLAASSQDVPESMNRYLFSSTGAVSTIAYTTVDRITLMFVFSLVALLAVLPFFYLAPLRQPPAYFAIGVILAALAITFPGPAVLFGQAGAIGVALALVACVLRRVIGTPQPASLAPRSRVHVAPDSQPSGLGFGEGSSRATTATAPAHLKVAQVETES